tara:strand:- start:1340 stop:1840 length:501 start_codon:yes stop_codon:yes gene_type:complete
MNTMDLSNLQAELVKYGTLLVNKYRAQLKIDGTYATGNTSSSLNYVIGSGQLEILASSTLEKIDKGTEPGERPNTSDIIKWAEAKGVKPKNKNGGFIQVTDKSIFWMAKNIADTVGEVGTIKRFSGAGSGIIDFVYRNQKDEMLENIFVAYGRDIQEMIDEIVKIK